MRLKKLYLDGFGHFHKYAIDGISDNVTVFYGPNEAGKSTLLAFIRGVLFEFPRNVSSHYPPLSGGRHGGSVTVSDADGETHIIERFGRKLSVVGPSGKASDPKGALNQLTGGITQNHFKNILAFSIDELQRDDTLDDSNIYSAGQGVPRLPALLESLEERKRIIYHPRGRKKTLVIDILNKLQEVDGHLKNIEKNAEDYGKKSTRKTEVDGELGAIDEQLARMRVESERVNRLREGWSDWVELNGIKTQLKEIPQFDKFPEDSVTRLDDFEKQIRQAEEEMDGVKEELRQAEEDASMVVHGETLLDDNDRIEEIRRARGKFDSAIRDLPERQGELKDMENNLSERLGALGEEWNESNLHDIDTSVTAQDQVNKQDHQLEEAGAAARSATTKLDGAKTKIDDLTTKKSDIQDQLCVDSEGQDCSYLEKLLDDRSSLEKVQSWERSFSNSVRDLPKLQGELESLKSNLKRNISDIGKDWDEDRLNTFDTSIELRQEVDHFKKLLADTRETARLNENLLEQETARLNECKNTLREAEEQMPQDDAPAAEDEIDLQRKALRTSRSRFDEYERARVNHENLSARLDALANSKGAGASTMLSSRLPPISMFAAGGALVAAGAYLGDSALVLSVAGGSALLGAVIYLLAARRQGKKGTSPEYAVLSRQTTEAKSSAEEAHLSLAKAASPLSIDDITNSALDVVEERLSSSEKALSSWKEVYRRVMDAQRALKSQELKTEEASQKAQANTESESKAQSQWLNWLEQHGLSDTLVPDTVIALIGRIKEARSILENIKDREQRIDVINGDIEEYFALVQQLADKYGLSFDGEKHQKARIIVDKLARELDRADKLVDQRDDVEDQIRQYGPAYDKAVADEKKASEKLASIQSKWHDWLQEHNIHDDFTPKTMLVFIGSANAAVTALDETRRMRTRIDIIEKSINEFRGKVEPLASTHNIPLNNGENEQVARAADLLIEKLETAQTEYNQRNVAMQKRDGDRQRFEQCEKRLQSAKKDLEALLQEGGASGSEDFRRRAAQHKNRIDLEQRRDEHDRALTRLSGPGEKKDAFLASLHNSDRSTLDAEYDRLEDEIDKMEGTRDELQEERGGLINALEQLAGEEESSVLRMRRNMLKEQLREHAREWSRLVLEKTLLEMTQQKFEQERQPDVIKRAQEFFYNVTGKRYNRLSVPIDEQKIMVVDANGNTKQPHELSRGTKEQLYLALRFGLIQDLGERTERLPVVIDEVLVNFDPDRARLAVQSLEQLARTNQVLVFTCHPGMRDLFVDVANAKVVEIKSE